ncbi:MAG: T9SS type A sorting domain-containing protein [Flavobacterium sp.]|nr:T9SS type A sorting domain-containing protein [Flavobacterium sp.]
MKTKLLFIGVLLISLTPSFGQTVGTRFTLPYYEGFKYDVDTKLLTEGAIVGQGGWQTFAADLVAVAGSNPIIVSDPGWNMGGLPTPTYNALNFWSSGDDPVINFTSQGSQFVIFSSFIFRVPTPVDPLVDAWNDTTGEYIYSFGKTSTTNGVNYTSNVYLKKTAAAAKSFNIGIAETNTTAAGMLVWSSGTFNYDTDIVIVIKYQIDAANPTGLSTLYINPVITSSEPLVSNASTTADLTTSARTNLDKIRIMKSAQAKTPYIILDEIRVANTWHEVVGLAAPLGLVNNEISGLSVYPNPVVNGKLFISSSNNNEKQVAVYNLLGQKVLQTKTTNNSEINVSELAKGAYVLEIKENGASVSKKLMIQ